jgi:hypothetical protein
VALVAGNFPPEDRPRAYGLVMGAGAIAVAVGPLIGGIATTYFSWRWVFAGEVLVVIGILALARRVHDAPPEESGRFDVVAAVVAALGLGAAVLGVLRSAEWGWVSPKPGSPSLLGVSPTLWFIIVGLLLVWAFLERESRMEERNEDPLVKPSMFSNRQMTGGLLMFLLLYLVRAGLFFTIPLFLSVSLGLTALETGVRILPLSITLLAAAVGIPRFLPHPSPRRVVRLGLLAMLAGHGDGLRPLPEAAGRRHAGRPPNPRRPARARRSRTGGVGRESDPRPEDRPARSPYPLFGVRPRSDDVGVDPGAGCVLGSICLLDGPFSVKGDGPPVFTRNGGLGAPGTDRHAGGPHPPWGDVLHPRPRESRRTAPPRRSSGFLPGVDQHQEVVQQVAAVGRPVRRVGAVEADGEALRARVLPVGWGYPVCRHGSPGWYEPVPVMNEEDAGDSRRWP